MTDVIKLKRGAALIISVMIIACSSGTNGDPKEKEVVRGVNFVKKLINSTATNDLAALSLASLAEQGGTITSFIAANMPDNEKFTCYIEAPDPKPYCVLIKPGASPGEYFIEGYGQNTDKPLLNEKAVASMPHRR